jgi:hypothetical protein
LKKDTRKAACCERFLKRSPRTVGAIVVKADSPRAKTMFYLTVTLTVSTEVVIWIIVRNWITILASKDIWILVGN